MIDELFKVASVDGSGIHVKKMVHQRQCLELILGQEWREQENKLVAK